MNPTATNVFSDKTLWFYIVSIVSICLYMYLHVMCIYYSCCHLPRRMGLFWSGALSEDSKQRIEFLLSTSPHIGTSTNMLQPLSPLSRFATNILSDKTQISLSPFLTNGHKRKPTIAPLSLYASNTLCLPSLSIFFSSYITTYYSELPWLINKELQIRSNRTALDFRQTDFNAFPGVGISTRCFCLNYHQLSHLQLLLTFLKATATTTSHRSISC